MDIIGPSYDTYNFDFKREGGFDGHAEKIFVHPETREVLVGLSDAQISLQPSGYNSGYPYFDDFDVDGDGQADRVYFVSHMDTHQDPIQINGGRSYAVAGPADPTNAAHRDTALTISVVNPMSYDVDGNGEIGPGETLVLGEHYSDVNSDGKPDKVWFDFGNSNVVSYYFTPDNQSFSGFEDAVKIPEGWRQ